jgi:hypothetical protein
VHSYLTALDAVLQASAEAEAGQASVDAQVLISPLPRTISVAVAVAALLALFSCVDEQSHIANLGLNGVGCSCRTV